ncbi:hypothetical protein [Haloferax marisrubri]|uniref:Glycosyltransferase RgtA/B/C/D-like domain-containing protein n=1 Tax=Haloferax marisrubri TaxID=1544719 RepID=A0A2P4NR10_9EURY|nr:hypothetical protein [Haloferax marisrubri]POG55518.1 hypothetical protein AUR65_008890 [Haloferax marisrubri]
MGVADRVIQRVSTDYVVRPPTAVTDLVFFATVTALLTFPLLAVPDRIHLTAPATYSFFHDGAWTIQHPAKGGEYIDHLGAMAAIEGGIDRLLAGNGQIIILSDYTIPPTYIIAGMVTTLVFPISTILFHNLYFVVSMFLAGVFTYLFVRAVLDDREVALLAGVLYMSSFYLFNAYVMGHTNQWQVQWIPLILFSVERMRVHAATDFVGKSVVLLSLAFVIQVLSSMQYAVYLSFVLPLYVLLRLLYGETGFRSALFWKGFGASTLLAAIVTSPYLYARFRLIQAGTTSQTTLQADNYVWYQVQNVIGEFFAADAPLQFTFRLLLIVGGVVTLYTVSRRRFRQLAPFAFLFGICVLIAWGPFSPWAPYSLFHTYWPLVGYFRVPYRILPFALLGSSTLAASVLLHLSESETDWMSLRGAVLIVITAIQIALVHSTLMFYEYLG